MDQRRRLYPAVRVLHWLFTDHPHEVGETYFEHQRHALAFTIMLMAAGFACLVHALVPALFQRTASRTVTGLNDRMVLNRAAPQTVAAAGITARDANPSSDPAAR